MATQPDEALLETLRLIGDLSEALATQVRRLERLGGELPGGTPTAMIGALVGDAERVKDRCDELRRRLGDSDSAEVVELRASSGAPKQGGAAGAAPATADAVHTLAIQMRMEGRTQDEVEEYLAQSFGRDDAARVAGEVFRRPGPGGPPGQS
ncbi:MAG TPA: hypothetical protein VGN78_11535 [Solirubrobacteraceae bacterium]|jgi:hypothetical protein|nr:hypothetical protein [Solirubrobacteraceae bacterium]